MCESCEDYYLAGPFVFEVAVEPRAVASFNITAFKGTWDCATVRQFRSIHLASDVLVIDFLASKFCLDTEQFLSTFILYIDGESFSRGRLRKLTADNIHGRNLLIGVIFESSIDTPSAASWSRRDVVGADCSEICIENWVVGICYQSWY